MMNYRFTGEELIDLGQLAAGYQRTRDEYEAQLTSIKSDYKGKIEGSESNRDGCFRKMTDGYEMRDVQAVVEFNAPKKGRKTLFLLDEDAEDKKGVKIGEEGMTQADLQMTLDESDAKE